jgi:hypothetical protein
MIAQEFGCQLGDIGMMNIIMLQHVMMEEWDPQKSCLHKSFQSLLL